MTTKIAKKFDSAVEHSIDMGVPAFIFHTIFCLKNWVMPDLFFMAVWVFGCFVYGMVLGRVRDV